MKLALIGGAGVRAVFFTKSLTMLAQEIGITKFVMYDINREKLEIIGKLCKHVVAESGIPMELEFSDDIEYALTDADYVITTIRVGNDRSRVIDEQIALKYGVIGQETTGPGGFSMAIRTIPVLLDYCEKIKRLAPNAWVFNFTNPSGLVTQAMHTAGYDRVIGICDTPSSTKIRIAEAINANPDELYVEFVGLNHLSWITSVVQDGEELLQDLVSDKAFIAKVGEFKMFDPDLIDTLKLLPNEYLYYYYNREQAVENIMKSGDTRAKFVEANNAEMLRVLGDMDIDSNPEEALQTYLRFMHKRESSYMAIETSKGPIEQPAEDEKLEMPNTLGYAGVMLDFARAMNQGIEKHIVLNIPAGDYVEGFEKNDVLEITCRMTAEGAVPVTPKKLPEHAYQLMKNVKLFERYTVEAVLNKSKDSAIKALMVHPLVNSYSMAKSLVNDYLEAYADILGEWE
ncbi:glycoside hydrolase [Bacillus sp. FJAT-27264]|uniref:family 4 glycosyl hydrolase n=1 Tax=Paenibacillus sp. (strain DSM 101736 / FJAT-27264) TaxID=1850362 RepID=UPI00080814B7|nr:glycoside hydrolase [Bacillus sp. FJAT-27264]OBZ13995.1 glycoside hydrolase [Bacillus sp. FJAT-27264]